MCGRFTLTVSEQVIADLFELAHVPEGATPRFNIAPTQQVLTVRGTSGHREGEMMRWGLVPRWADDLSIGNRMINARSETVAEKPAFRDAYRQRRCLIAADGFIEWKRSGRGKQPYWIKLSESPALAFAGLWERWRDEDGLWVPSCTILTTTPNDTVRSIHDRMPVIISPEHYDAWLDAPDPSELLEPFAAGPMSATKINPAVNNVANDSADCLRSIDVQGELF